MRILLLLLTLVASAEIVDRLAVSVGDEIITEQQVFLHLKTAAFLNGEPVKTDPTDKKRAAQKLIEIALIRIELENNRYPMPNESEIAEYFDSILKQRFNGDAAKYKAALAQYGITDAEFRESLMQQLATLAFIDFRFRPGVQIPEDEIREYYDYDYDRELKGKKKPSYNQARAAILEGLTQQRIDNLLDRWLNQTEAATKVRWIDAVFAAPQKEEK
ncbi:hypothetical protein [Bryobacter aggregatus]|uniref:hypothetical protein n=1 Tax=Bryobacter aggregatus TaxID=360054 RepID=UPI0004E1E6DC|nr:hypothetical protein [Bryobacter aggregatus]